MICIGHLNRHDDNLSSVSMEEYFSGNVMRDATLLKEVIKYLRSAHYCAGVMNLVNDVFTGDVIDGAIYLTDDTYIWPIYFPYYIEKYPDKVFIPSDLIDHLIKNDFKIPQISKKRLSEIERIFIKKWQGES